MSVHPESQPGTQFGTQYGQTNTTIVMNQPAYTVVQQFRESPIRMKCYYCRTDIVTATFYETGTFTWIACFILFFIGCDLGCCLIPFCIASCKDVVHQCPNCNQVLGRYNRM